MTPLLTWDVWDKVGYHGELVQGDNKQWCYNYMDNHVLVMVGQGNQPIRGMILGRRGGGGISTENLNPSPLV